MKPMKFLFATIAFVIFYPAAVSANVKLPYFFSDNMILQQQSEAAIFGWASPNSKVSITTSWNKKKYTANVDAEGKWKTNVTTPTAGGPYDIIITEGNTIAIKNILIGEVWLCSGQSNMEMPMKGFKDQPVLGSNDAVFNSDNNEIRLYTVPRSAQRTPQDTSKNSPWKIASPESVNNFSATAYYFGKLLYEKLHVPIGLVNITYGGSPVEAFMDVESLKNFPEIKLPAANGTEKLSNKIANTLYNGMLHPFLGYTIKGCIWYQGETNYDRAKQYETLFPAFVKMVRTQSNNDSLPFYFAQIAPYNYSNYATDSAPKYNSAFLRDAQRKALQKIPNSGMICLMDIGEENSIHPANKEIGGKRFAYLALAKTYGRQGFGYAGPLFDSLLINGNVATIKFFNANNGLTSFSKTLTNFEIAGADKIFRPAKAVISQGKVLVSSPEIANPVAVRYAFKDFVMVDLFNTEGFPASSFRTDNW
jgi:sialate O-acetylesterase